MKQFKTPLSDPCREIILGSLLGDGSIAINKNFVNARFSFRHSLNQKEYFDYKVKMLKEISSHKDTWQQVDTNSYGKHKLRYQSKALETLTDIHRITTKHGRKYVTRRWLNQLTPLSLAVWWFDDGSLISNSRKGVLCTDNFSLKEVEVIARYFLMVWNIKTSISKTSKRTDRLREYYRIHIRSTQELKKFLAIILPHIPVEEMIYKVLILYKDSELQERWISELAEKSNFSRAVIEKQLLIKRQRSKNFRE